MLLFNKKEKQREKVSGQKLGISLGNIFLYVYGISNENSQFLEQQKLLLTTAS